MKEYAEGFLDSDQLDKLSDFQDPAMKKERKKSKAKKAADNGFEQALRPKTRKDTLK